jgi:hypothetical protein
MIWEISIQFQVQTLLRVDMATQDVYMLRTLFMGPVGAQSSRLSPQATCECASPWTGLAAAVTR